MLCALMEAFVDRQALKERLKALRGRLALYQHEVAADMGVPRRTFQSWENVAVERVSETTYSRLASYYSEKLGEKITLEVLLFGPQVAAATVGDLEAVRKDLEGQIATLRAQLLLSEEMQPTLQAV